MTALAAIAVLGAGLPLRAELAPPVDEAQPEVVRVQPTGPWKLDYGETDCLLQRGFEKDGQRYFVTIKQNAPGQSFGLTLAGPALKRLLSVKGLSLELSDRGPLPIRQTVLTGQTPEYETTFVFQAVLLDGPPTPAMDGVPQLHRAGIDPARAATADRIVLANDKGRKGVWFETGSLQPAFAALNTCTEDLLAQWGLDPQLHRSYTPPVMRNPEAMSKLLLKDFPTRAVAFGESGFFSFRVIVETDGTVSSCHIEARTKVNYLDPRCEEVLRTVRFDPAKDAQGNPMRSFYATTISYVVP